MKDWRTALNWRSKLEAIVEAVPRDSIPDLLGELARHTACLNLRLNTHPQPATDNGLDRQLTCAEVAGLLAVSRNWVYSNRKKLGGVKLAGAVRYSELQVRRFLASG